MSELKAQAVVVPGLTAVVGGAIGAVLTFLLLKPSAVTRVQPERTAAVEHAEPAKSPLDGRIAALERAVQALSLRDSMARATAKGPSDAGAEKQPSADVAPIVDNPVFEAAVRDVMERAEQERNVEREAQRAEWRKQASEDWANDLTGKLRLTDMQKAKDLAVASDYWDKLRDLRQGDAGAAPTRQELRARMDELRAAAETELGKVLSPTQMNSYRELDQASRLGTRRNRGQ